MEPLASDTGDRMSPAIPFAPRPAGPALIHRLLRRAPAAAFVEINNLLAATARVRAVPADAVLAICLRYRVDLLADLGVLCASLYRDYLRFCLRDRRLTDEEVADLAHLQDILGLGDDTVRRVHRQVAREVYSRTVEEILADAEVDSEERAFLTQVRENLRLPAGEADNILEVKSRQRSARDRVPKKRR
jgi:hypothetical protein